jgi:hypothetical protein
MKILSDSLTVLARDGNIVFGFLFAMLMAGGIIFFLFGLFLDRRLAASEYFALSIAGALFILLLGVIPLVLLSFLFKSNVILWYIPGLIFVFCFLFFLRQNRRRKIHKASVSLPVLLLVLIISIYVRLAFISGVIVPPYFDSAAHYLMINRLMASYQTLTIPSFDSIAGGYYHLGFHVLIAAISLVLHLNVKDTMLVFGQTILALIPIPLFLIVRRETRSDLAALFTVLLAAWAWSMPAYAVNWGKYPALTGILAFEFTLSTGYLAFRSPKRYRWILSIACLLSIVLASFIHSRILVLTGIAFVSALATLGWRTLSGWIRKLIFFLTFAAFVILLIITHSNPVFTLALDPYLQNGLWIALMLLFLFPFACAGFPSGVFWGILSLVMLLASLYIPLVDILPGRAYQTLLDRPFVEMFLFLPLSLMAGLGFAGLIKFIDKRKSAAQTTEKLNPVFSVLIFQRFITFVLFGLIFANALAKYNLYPSDCCQIFKVPDSVAFGWMDNNLPRDTTILIPSAKMVFFESNPLVAGDSASDAGIWLTALINRKTFSLSHNTNFGAQNILTILRRQNIRYIYVGSSSQSFHEAQLKKNPSVYKLVFSLPGAHIYELINVP